MINPDILLIQPPVRDFYLTHKRTIPYGLCSIATAIKKKRLSVEIFDAMTRQKSRIIETPEHFHYLEPYYGSEDLSPFSLFHNYRHFGYSFQYISKELKKKQPKIAGISSLFTAYSEEALRIAEIVRKSCPEAVIIIGGHHPTEMPESVLSHPAVDFILRGEGEESLPLFIRRIKDGKPVSDIPGIGWKDSTGKCHIQEPVYINSEKNFPCTDLDLADVTHYKRMSRHSIVTVSSRGCPMTCSYCSFGSNRYKYRHRSVDSVVKEIRQNIKDESTCFIDFEDEHLSLKKSWFMDLLNKLISLFKGKQVELRAMNGLFPPSLDSDVVLKMKEAGFKTLNLSLGSSSKKQLERFNRPDMLHHLDSALLDAEKNSLDAVCYIIAGAPYQTPESTVKDLLFLAERRTLAGVSVYYPAPGSADFERYDKENLFPDTFDLYRSSVIPVSHRTSRKESVTLLRLGRILNFIKHLTDIHGSDLHSILNDQQIRINKDRDNIGLFLLNKFLETGNIYGMTADHNLFQHTTSHTLCQNFLSGLKHISIRGVKSNHQVHWKG